MRCWTAGLPLLVLLLGVWTPPAFAKDTKAPEGDAAWADPIVRMHVDVEYDGAYVIAGLRLLADQVMAEMGPDAKSIHEIQALLEMIDLLGIGYLEHLRQETRIDDAGYRETFTATFQPEGAATPIGKWVNQSGTSSRLVTDLPASEFLLATTLGRPGEYLELCNDPAKMEHLLHFADTKHGAMGATAASLFREYIPKLTALFQGSSAVHVLILDVNVMALQPSAAVLIEYDQSPEPFLKAFDSYTRRRDLQWTTQMQDAVPYQVLNEPKDMPLPLTWAVDGTRAVFATDAASAKKVLDLATTHGGTKSKRSKEPPVIYQTRLNMQKLRTLVPDWAVDLGMAQLATASPDVPQIEYRDLMNMEVGELVVTRSSIPHTVQIDTTMNRAMIHVLYKGYERAIVAGIKQEIRKEKERKMENAATEGAREIQDALEAYFDAEGQYPTSLTALTDGYLLAMPQNPYTGSAMRVVTFESRATGEISYYPQTEGFRRTGYQLVLYGPDDRYADWVDNTTRAADGSLLEEPDGYEDLILEILRPWRAEEDDGMMEEDGMMEMDDEAVMEDVGE